MIRGVARMLVAVVLVALVIPGQAMADRSFAVSGSLTYTWQGDPAAGCAQAGVCGVQGALTLGSGGGSSSSGGGGPFGGLIDVPLDASGATVRVADGAGGGECIDQPVSQLGGGDLQISRRGGRLVGRVAASLSSGRCAGPRQADLAAVLLPVRRRAGKRVTTYDLRTTESFVAGPFTGRLVSTLVVRSAPSNGGSQSASSGPVPPPPSPPTHKVLLEQVTLRYRLASIPGTPLNVAFSGESDPFCAALDSCGAAGTLRLGLSGFDQTLIIQASRRVARPMSARKVLADLRRGRLRVSGGEVGVSRTGLAAQAAETFAGPGGFSCQATSETQAAQLFFSVGPGRTGRSALLSLDDPVDLGIFRTYCPGPSDVDVLGRQPGVARASIGMAQLLARHSVVSLPLSGGFAGIGYVGTRSGALGFSLTLERIRARTVKVTRP